MGRLGNFASDRLQAKDIFNFLLVFNMNPINFTRFLLDFLCFQVQNRLTVNTMTC